MNNIDSKVTSWFSPKVRIGESSIVGTGLFATDFIKKDEVVAIKGGHIVSKKVFKKLDHDCQVASLQISDNLYVSPLSYEEIPKVMNYINHSCSPNVGLRGQLFTVAMRDIQPDEELTGDYCIAYTEEEFELMCSCGTAACRKTITSHDWQMPELQEKYRGYFCQYLADKIKYVV